MVSTGLPNAIVTGIVTGSIVAMGGIGLALVYSIAEVPNFAHGDLLMIGAYIALFVNKPGTVPVFELLATGERALSAPGVAVLFVLTAGSFLGMVYLLDGREALFGSWWPSRPSPTIGIGVHLIVAVLLGAIVVVGMPSIWVSVLLAALLLSVLAPLTERIVFGKFRAQDATLATMLIASLGVSFILRFGTQAVYGGAARIYSVPSTVDVVGSTFYITAAKFFDLYVAGGVVVRIIDTGPEGNATVATIDYSSVVIAAVIVGTTILAVAGYYWRRRVAGDRVDLTLGPRLAAAIFGVLGFLALAFLLGSPGSVPEEYAYATRFRLFPIKSLIVLIAIGMMAVLHLLLQETKLGTAMRASSDNLDLAKVTGINTDRVMMATWILAGLFAGIAGVMLGISLSRVQVNIGFFLLLPMFAAVILGGIRSVYGVILGAYVVGIAMDVGFTVLPVGNEFRVPIAFIVLVIVLLIKPEGLVGGS